MNIYIPDIKLPKDEPGAFQVIVIYVGADRKIRAECEGTHEVTIVPPHGRLIDADALTIILSKVIDINASIEQRNEATDQERRCLWWFEQQIGIAPTIIEAEEGET